MQSFADIYGAELVKNYKLRKIDEACCLRITFSAEFKNQVSFR